MLKQSSKGFKPSVYEHLDHVSVTKEFEVLYFALVHNGLSALSLNNEAVLGAYDTLVLVTKQMTKLLNGIKTDLAVDKLYLLRDRKTAHVMLGDNSLVTPARYPRNKYISSFVIGKHLTCVLVGPLVCLSGYLLNKSSVDKPSVFYRMEDDG